MDRSHPFSTVVVTGAGSGIGEAIAKRFSHEGRHVTLVDLNEQRLAASAAKIVSAGGACIAIRANVASSDDCAAVAQRLNGDGVGVSTLVNNAGITRAGNVIDLPEEDWDKVLNSNLKSVYLMAKNIIPLIAQSGGGSVINIASTAGISGAPYRVAYTASKSGVVNLSRSLAIDHAQDNIRVNCLCPGVIDTESMRRSFSSEARLEEARRNHLLRRLGRPEEVAAAAWFLASDQASFITGAILAVDGGLSCGHHDMPVGVRFDARKQ